MRQVNGAMYIPPGMCDGKENTFFVQPGAWRVQDANTVHLANLPATHSQNTSNEAKNMWDILADYFMSNA